MYSTTLPFFYAMSLMLSTGLGVVSYSFADDASGNKPVATDVKPLPPVGLSENTSTGTGASKVETQTTPVASHEPPSVATSVTQGTPAPSASPSPQGSITGPIEPQAPIKIEVEKTEAAKDSLTSSTEPQPAVKSDVTKVDSPEVHKAEGRKDGHAEFNDPVKGKPKGTSVGERKEPTPGTPLTYIDTMEKALISAYLSNSEIREQRQAVRAADERVAQARAGWRPRITGNASLGYEKQVFSGDNVKHARRVSSTSGLEGDRTYSRSMGVQVEQNIFNGGGTVYATQAADASVKAARAALYDTEQKVLLAAIKAYLDLLTKEAELEFLKSNEDVLKKTLDATQDKFSVGEETRTSVAQAEGEYAAAVARRHTAEAELEAIRAGFIRVIGQAPGKLTIPNEPNMMPENLQVAIEKSRLQNPAIIKAQFDEVAARREIDRVNSGLLPKLDLTGGSSASRAKERQDPANRFPGQQTRLTNDTVDHKVALNLSIPIYDQGFTRSQKREALETAEQRRIAIETARRQVEEGIITAWEGYQTSKVNITFYETQVRAGEVSVEGTRQEMQVGSKILLDVLNELRKLIDAQLQLVQEKQRYYYNGYLVRQLMGMLTAQALHLDVSLYDPEVHYQETSYRFW
jgi:outer membrane protein